MSISNEWFNSNELCPCPPREMYVKQKYSNFKEEIANYEHLPMRQYQTKVVAKVDSYMNTYAVKRLKAAYIPHLHCDIQPNEVVLHRHLVSLCLYTDYSDLSTHFSRTFTRNNMFESLTSVNARNSRYWWLSRSLYELVQFYGQSCEGQYNENTAEFEDKLCGPFFWGLYRLITFPEVSIRLYGPVSTSKQIEVAMKFSGKQGILVQLHTTGDYYCKQVRGFDASWFSRFAGEDETLFFGSDFRLRIESIRIISTVHKPDEEAFYAFFIFECMLNGCRPPHKIKLTDTVNRYVTSLWNWKLNKTDPDTPIDPYISDTFVNICSRTQIALNLWCLDTLFPNEWTDLLMQYIKPQNDYDDVCNLFRADVFRICTNIEKLIIHASSRDGKLQYAFDLFALLSIVFNLKGAITVIIKSRVPFKNKKMISSVFNDNTSDLNENADVNTDDEEISDIRSWIHNMCQQNNGQSWINIEKAFGAKGLAISYTRTGRTENEDCLTITRRRKSQIRNDVSYRYKPKSKQQMNQYAAPVKQRGRKESAHSKRYCVLWWRKSPFSKIESIEKENYNELNAYEWYHMGDGLRGNVPKLLIHHNKMIKYNAIDSINKYWVIGSAVNDGSLEKPKFIQPTMMLLSIDKDDYRFISHAEYSIEAEDKWNCIAKYDSRKDNLLFKFVAIFEISPKAWNMVRLSLSPTSPEQPKWTDICIGYIWIYMHYNNTKLRVPNESNKVR
eukprot:144484_1